VVNAKVTGLQKPSNTTPPAIAGGAKARKKLACSTGTWTNNPTAYAYKWSRDGTPIDGATGPTYNVARIDEGLTLTCTVTASDAGGSGRPATSKGVLIKVPPVAGCPAATGRLGGETLGLVTLGVTRAQARQAYRRSSDRGKRFEDFFCLTPIGVRVGYASTELLQALPRGERNQLRGRVIFASTASAVYSLRGIRPGATLAAAAAALGAGAPFHIGLNFWYMAPVGRSTVVLKVRRNIVEEIGIADKRLTTGRTAQLTFIKSFS
jgi:hypothetical protein